jgi:hypothetical protein
LGAAACKKDIKPEDPSSKKEEKAAPKEGGKPVAAGPKMPGASGAEVVEYFTKISPYQTWNLLPISKYPNTIRTEYARNGAHRFFNGKIAKTYYNDIGKKALDAGEATMPVGTMIVVPRWDQAPDGSIGDEDKPSDIVVMYRIKDYDPANGDWFYLTYKDGAIGVEGKVEKCQKCHEAVKDKDFRFTDSGLMTAIAPKTPPVVNDKGEEFVKSVTSGFHYTHYEVLPDEKMGKIIPRVNDFASAIDWFNGNLAARIFVNKIALDAINSGSKENPEGAMYIAEQYKRDKDNKPMPSPFAIVAQVKVKGFDPKHGDWAYVAYSFEENKILAFGGSKEAKFCTSCHDQVKDNDYIWSTSGKRPKK